MGRLAGHITYLIGPMETISDGGISWRNWITPKLNQRGIGVFNPCDKATEHGHEGEAMRTNLKDAKDNKNWTKVQELTKEFVGIDARMVNLSSFCILYIDKDSHMCGSYVEFGWAVQQKKPVLVYCQQGRENMPGFVSGMSPPELLFNSWLDLWDYIVEIDTCKEVKDTKRWTFFDMKKVFGNQQLEF